jgi:hypothetical protein
MMLAGAVGAGLFPGACAMPQQTEPPAVRLLLERSGGQLPTFRPRVEVPLAALPPALQGEAQALIGAAQAHATRGARHPDAFTYRITVTRADGSSRVLEFGDADGHDAALDALADWIRANKP